MQDPIIIGVDPGTTHSALCVLSEGGDILGFGKYENRECVEELRKIAGGHRRPRVIIEMVVSYGITGKSINQTLFWTGVFAENCKIWTCDVFMVYRKTIVTAVCGSPKANDKAVRAKMIELYGEPGTKKNPGKTYRITKDCWAALSCATYGLAVKEPGKAFDF